MKKIFKIVLYIFMSILAIILLIGFLWMRECQRGIDSQMEKREREEEMMQYDSIT